MEYNSQKSVLIIPEYGRNMQELIKHTLTIEDREHRLAYLKRIISLMQQMHPQSNNAEDSKLKLWQHAIRIAGQDFDVELPEGIEAEHAPHKPDMISYPEEINRFRHYGKNVRTMIQKAIEMEDGPIKDGFIRAIASYMKVAYQNWHRELNVNDDIIRGDLMAISNGKLNLPQDIFNAPTPPPTPRRRNTSHGSSYYKRDSGYSQRNQRNNRGSRRRKN
jgi:hypothetical protein